MAQLRANDFAVSHDGNQADGGVVIINTCGFIDNAKKESIDSILGWAQEKKEGRIGKLYVTGCLSERYKDDLSKEIAEVDAWFGTRELPRLLKTLKADYKHELIGERLLATPSHYAYFKISEGCDRPCSFCAIPLMRGKHISTPVESLVESARKLAAQGVKELILIAQDLTFYGIDIYGKRSLAGLLQKLEEVEGIEWIRLHYAFPAGFPLEVLEVMRESKKICRYLDMPLQHISTRVLKSMRRGIGREKTEDLICRIREGVPGIAIRTTMMLGYPGEGEEDFLELLDFVGKMKFERLGCFTYSHEENTHAFGLEDDVPAEVKQERADAVMKLQSGISRQLNGEMVGSELKVLVDKAEGGKYIARSEFDSPEVDNEVHIPVKDNYLRIGDFANVKITSAAHYDLQAVPV